MRISKCLKCKFGELNEGKVICELNQHMGDEVEYVEQPIYECANYNYNVGE